MRTVARDHQAETREFLLGLLVAFGTVVVVVMATLYVLGLFASPHPAVEPLPAARPRVYSSQDLTPQPKPTAVWRFRPEWLKPERP